MEEKIKVSLPKITLELLKSDCEDFRIVKENGSPNMNAFINTLIVNYYETFSASEESLHDDIKKSLVNVSSIYREKVFQDILKIFAKRVEANYDKKDNTTFSFKPTKFSKKATIFIEHTLLEEQSLSSYYRRMFISYSEKTKNEREKIIHKENFELLQNAISKGVQVCVSTTANTIMNKLSVYSISAGKDELYNYVLATDRKRNVTLRLAKIKTVSLLSTPADISERNIELFKRQIECGAQYTMYNTDDEPIKVRLSDKGKTLFQKIYLYRPTPISIDGDVYTFNCSQNQLIYYFERFGEHAVILSPHRLGVFMRNYHYYALKKYREIYH